VAGEVFEVTLVDLPGAGYVWTPADIPVGLTLIEGQPDVPATDVVGSAHPTVMRFRADQPGQYEIMFTFARPWEDRPVEERVVRVRVRSRDSQESP
jgi:predicted secreted protein